MSRNKSDKIKGVIFSIKMHIRKYEIACFAKQSNMTLSPRDYLHSLNFGILYSFFKCMWNNFVYLLL